MTKKGIIFFIVILVFAVLIFVVVKRQKPHDQYREFMRTNKPWQEYVNTKDAIYLKDNHIMIAHDAESDQYWLSDLNNFYDVFYDKVLHCLDKNREVPCSPVNDLKDVYTIFSATFSTKENSLSVTFINSTTEDTPEPELYVLSSTLDGRNIRISN